MAKKTTDPTDWVAVKASRTRLNIDPTKIVVRERMVLAGVDREIDALLRRFLRKETPAGRALCHMQIIDALVTASAR